MARRIKTTLTILPKTKRQPKVPKPTMPKVDADFSTKKSVRARAGINLPGIKTM